MILRINVTPTAINNSQLIANELSRCTLKHTQKKGPPRLSKLSLVKVQPSKHGKEVSTGGRVSCFPFLSNFINSKSNSFADSYVFDHSTETGQHSIFNFKTRIRTEPVWSMPSAVTDLNLREIPRPTEDSDDMIYQNWEPGTKRGPNESPSRSEQMVSQTEPISSGSWCFLSKEL